jgi:hypothetical protein
LEQVSWICNDELRVRGLKKRAKPKPASALPPATVIPRQSQVPAEREAGGPSSPCTMPMAETKVGRGADGPGPTRNGAAQAMRTKDAWELGPALSGGGKRPSGGCSRHNKHTGPGGVLDTVP